MQASRKRAYFYRLQKLFAATVCATVALMPIGCHSKTAATPENFIAALNAHFADHPECLFPEAPRFPYETSDPVKTKQMDALADALMLTARKEPSIHVSRYVPTTVGERAAPRFCYGHRNVTSIDSFTPPAPSNGFTETQVAYHYTVVEVPVWAKSEAMRAAFPAMALEMGGGATGKATLAATMADWQVPE
jgi:hypothetical protein